MKNTKKKLAEHSVKIYPETYRLLQKEKESGISMKFLIWVAIEKMLGTGRTKRKGGSK